MCTKKKFGVQMVQRGESLNLSEWEDNILKRLARGREVYKICSKYVKQFY